MQVRDVMNVDVPAIDPSSSIQEAAELLASEGVEVLLVVDEGKLVGVISEGVLKGVLDALADLDHLLPPEPLAVTRPA